MQTKPKFDPNSPRIKAYLEDLERRTFTSEGTFVAFPTCYPGMTVPIPLDESRITALAVTPDGIVYGGTSGRQAHLFAGSFHGLTGIVFDLGAIAGATECAAVCCGPSRFLAFVNGPRGGRILSAPLLSMHEDLIQEWGFERPRIDDRGEAVAGEPVVHAVSNGKLAAGVTTGHLFTADFDSAKVHVAGEVPAAGRIALASGGGIVGREGGYLWHYDPVSDALHHRAVRLPDGAWDHPLTWATARKTGRLYTADADGRLFSYDEAAGFSSPVGRAPLAPVGPMACAGDGRLFGFCGAEMAKMFCYDPARGEVSNLGVAVSVLSRRRYGYVFGDAVTGRDGEILFGENDNGGHLWLYFPALP